MLNKNACSNPYSVWPQKKVYLFLLPKMYFILSLLPTPNYPLSQLSISKLSKGSTFFFGEKNEFYFHENKSNKLNRIHIYPCFTAKALAI